MSASKRPNVRRTKFTRELCAAGVPQIPPALEREILAGVQEPSAQAQAAAKKVIDAAMLALQRLHLAEKSRQDAPKGARAGYGGKPGGGRL